MANTLEKQVGGDHYKKLGLQPWEVIAKNGLDFFEGSALAYLLRWKEKGGIQDLDKIIHYIEHIKQLAEQGHYGEKFKSIETGPRIKVIPNKESVQELEKAKKLEGFINWAFDQELTAVLKAEEAQERHLRSKLYKISKDPSKKAPRRRSMASNQPSGARSRKSHSKPLTRAQKEQYGLKMLKLGKEGK